MQGDAALGIDGSGNADSNAADGLVRNRQLVKPLGDAIERSGEFTAGIGGQCRSLADLALAVGDNECHFGAADVETDAEFCRQTHSS